MENRFPISVLDLAPILQGHSIATTFANSLDLAQKTENWGYTRYWLAEHHNMPNIASSATAVLIGQLAAHTRRMRIGSGGIMLPNHAPLMVAEQFGTLGTLFPGRIDLGLGRAPGTDPATSRALRRDVAGAQHFHQLIAELQTYLSGENASGPVRAIPGEGVDVPLWVLGSSTDSAHLAASKGLPYAFASHFAPRDLHAALDIYRKEFQPSAQLSRPRVMACVNVIAADTDALAGHLATSFFLLALGIIRGSRHPLAPPVESMETIWSPGEAYAVEQMMRYSFIGSPATVQTGLREFIRETKLDELMVTAHIYRHTDRLKTYEILSGLDLTGVK